MNEFSGEKAVRQPDVDLKGFEDFFTMSYTTDYKFHNLEQNKTETDYLLERLNNRKRLSEIKMK